jgi:hypothetical protein
METKLRKDFEFSNSNYSSLVFLCKGKVQIPNFHIQKIFLKNGDIQYRTVITKSGTSMRRDMVVPQKPDQGVRYLWL